MRTPLRTPNLRANRRTRKPARTLRTLTVAEAASLTAAQTRTRADHDARLRGCAAPGLTRRQIEADRAMIERVFVRLMVPAVAILLWVLIYFAGSIGRGLVRMFTAGMLM